MPQSPDPLPLGPPSSSTFVAHPAAPEVAATLYDAIRYVLDRGQTDPEFRWHMLGTESFDRLTAAEAVYTGRDLAEVRAARRRDLQPDYRRREPECAVNRERVRDLEGLLEEHGIDYPPCSGA